MSDLRKVAILSLLLGAAACDAADARHKAAGNLHFKQGRYAEARKEYEAAVAANPKEPGGRILLGNALFELRDYAGARREFETALAADPKAPEAHRGLAIVIARTAAPGDPEAFAAFQRHIEAVIDWDGDGALDNPHDRNAIITAAQVLSEHANPADADTYQRAQRRAEELLRRYALPIDDKDPKTLFQLALVYARKGDAETALGVVDRLEAVAPGKGYGPYATAIVHALGGDQEKALLSVEELLKSDAIDPETVGRDSLLAPLAASPRFGELLAAAQARRKGAR